MGKSRKGHFKTKMRGIKRAKLAPQILEEDLDRSIRLHAYKSLQDAKELEDKGEEVPADIAEKAEHGVQLNHNDEQKRRLREKGHFFFVHPNAAPNAFPVVEDPKGKIEPYAPVVPEAERKVKFSKSYLKQLGIKERKPKTKKYFSTKDF